MTRYLSAVAGVTLGMFVHVILFNLYLSDLGFREDTMGRLAAAMTLGTALGTLPAGVLASRWGLKPTISSALAGLSLALAARAWFVSPEALLASSFLTGLFLSAWFVTNAPAIAALSGAETRATAFSRNTALAIGVGALGGLLAGALPGLLGSKRAALLAAAAMVVASMGSIAATRFGPTPPAPSLALSPQARRFLARYLAAVALWYGFAAGFQPFFNVYLKHRWEASTATIGGVFAVSQVIQALAALAMAPLIRRWGPMRAVVATQVLAAAAVLGLLPARTLAFATGVYILYMSLQVMSEPGLFNFLMAGVDAGERSGASAVNLLTMFTVQALVGWGAGLLIARQGYALLFVLLSITGFLAALVFGMTFRIVRNP